VPALGVDEEVEPDASSEVAAPDSEGGGEQVDELVVGRREYLERLLERERLAGKRLLGERIPARGGLRHGRHSG
jgi:hypothetical protein